MYTQEPRVANGSDDSGDLSLRECLLQETESMSKKIFHPKQCWFQMQEQLWTRNERRSYSGTQNNNKGKSTLLHWWTSANSKVHVHYREVFERTRLFLHVRNKFVLDEFVHSKNVANESRTDENFVTDFNCSPRRSDRFDHCGFCGERFCPVWPFKLQEWIQNYHPVTSTIIECSRLFPDEFW